MPQADRILSDMSEYLSKAGEFTFRAEVAYDSVLSTGQKILHGGSTHVTVRRPDRLHVEYRGDERRTQVVFDGRNFTVYDLAANVYSVTEVPPEIDAAVDHVFHKFGFSVPIADFLYSDPYEVLTESAASGFLVGRPKVDGIPCFHLAFSQEVIDWQIWIEDGPRPVPRQFVITYKDEEGSPQFMTRFSSWDFQPRLSDHYFRFEPSAGADQIEFLPIGQMEAKP